MIIIIGAGLSGLVTAYRLKQAKIPFKILEARDRLGGRILTKIAKNETPIELGATWFGRQHQNLIKLLNELELQAFPQYQGEYYFYDDANATHHGKYKLPTQEPTYRIAGGSSHLIEKLYEMIDKEDLQVKSVVKEISNHKDQLLVTVESGQQYLANQVILALPPKIWAHQIHFKFSLPEELIKTAQNTQTWMEDSIKGALEFESPFWRDKNLPATIMSSYGPFVECYDHTNHQENKFALCGFLNPAIKTVDRQERERLVKTQLTSILGDEVKNATSYQEYIWPEDDFVKWPKESFMQPHQNNGHAIFQESFLNNQLIISSSESATSYPGYMDGAVEAGENAFERVANSTLSSLKQK